MPPAGLCRVWHDGVPPGRQPRAMNCAEAERIAARDGGARVIYGDGRDSRRQGAGGGGVYDRYPGDIRYPGDTRYPDDSRTDRRRPTGESRRTGGRAIPRTERYPASGDARRPTGRAGTPFQSAAAASGYRDGLSADRGYTSRYGAKSSYQADYRRGFLEGYYDAYRRD